MRVTKGTVVDGRIVVEDETVAEGSNVTVMVSDEPTFTLTPEEESSLLEAIAEAERGDLRNAEDVLQRLK